MAADATFEFVTATANPHKVEEISAVLGAALPHLVLLPRPPHVPDVAEDAGTLVGNARLKAVALMKATGKPAISDDTGLFVDALNGLPGVDTAYFAGPHATYAENCDKLLSELARAGALDMATRTARFTSVAFVAWPDGSETWCEGHVLGRIVLERRGADGFGYDPLFAPDEADGSTFAELGAEAKNRLSHRARAFRLLAEKLLAEQRLR